MCSTDIKTKLVGTCRQVVTVHNKILGLQQSLLQEVKNTRCQCPLLFQHGFDVVKTLIKPVHIKLNGKLFRGQLIGVVFDFSVALALTLGLKLTLPLAMAANWNWY